MKFLRELWNTFSELFHLHTFSKDVIWGSLQLTILLYEFAALLHLIAPYTANFMRTVIYYRAALEVAPVVLAAGIVAGIISDLALRKNSSRKETHTTKKPPDDENKP